MQDELLWSRWTANARRTPDREAIVHWVAGEEPLRWTWRDLVDRAARFAHALRDAGVGPGDVCATIIRHHPMFYPLYMAISAIGAIPSVLAYPNPRLHPSKFVQGLEGMARRSGLRWILTERALEQNVRPLVEAPGTTVRGLLFPLEWTLDDRRDPPPAAAGAGAAAPCLLQHSSGTTGLQKAVVLSHAGVLAHARDYAAAIGLGPADRIASWLPLYHDMGLIAALHVPLAFSVPVVTLDPFEWVSAPVLLLEVISRERATLSWLPNFAYNLLADRVHPEELDGVRLDSVRMLVNCSEPVRAESHDRLLARYRAHGLCSDALGACYAMAETTFAVTQTSPGTAARTVVVDRDALARGMVVRPAAPDRARRCVSSGTPIPGCTVRVVSEDGAELGDGRVGELVVESRSLFDGYRNLPEETGAVLSNGRYRTGDLGFRMEGDVFVVGRKKDIIIVAGKNLYPEDIEDVVAIVPGVLSGRVVALGVPDEALGTEQVWVIAESEHHQSEREGALRTAIQMAAMGIDVTIARVFVAPPRWLVKSSAGKPSRKANRERLLAGELGPMR
jgi:acyl-CoA synthetase (AMP-forming)/AMP-acid ligase II